MCRVKQALNRRPLWYGKAVLPSCCISTSGVRAMADARDMHSEQYRA
jgi:hypothetical protein